MVEEEDSVRIAGLDLSIAGSGVCCLELDEQYGIRSTNFLGFTDVKKNEREDRAIYYKAKDFSSRFEQTAWMRNIILSRLDGVQVVAVERFAYSAIGMLADIGMFVGAIVQPLWERGVAIRWYEPQVAKKHFAGRGSADKVGMYEAYLARTGVKPNLDGYPVPKKKDGVKPTSDIVDAFALADTLRTELMLRKDRSLLPALPRWDREIFGKKSGSLLDVPFICKTDCYL